MSRPRKVMLIVLCSLWVVGFVGYVIAVGGKPLDIDKTRVEEPSGIVYHAGRGTLFVVGDEGKIYEMKTDGTPVNQRDLAPRLTHKGVVL